MKNIKLNAWANSLVGLFSGIALASVQNKVAPNLTILMEAFDIGMSTVGWLSSIFAITGIIIAIPAAGFLKNLGPKKTTLLALFSGLLGSVIGALTGNINILILSRIIEGFGVGTIVIVGPALIQMWFPPAKRGLPIGIWATWMIISQSITFLLSGPIATRFGWQGMWWFTAIFCIVAAILAFIFIDTPPKEFNHAQASEPLNDTKKISLLGGLKSLPTWLIALSAAGFTFASFGFVTFITPYWSHQTGWSISSTSKLVSFIYTSEIVWSIIIGFIMNKFLNHKMLGIFGYIVYACFCYLAFSVEHATLIIAVALIYPIFDTLSACICWSLGPQSAKKPEYIGISLSVLNIGLNFGTLIGPPVAGWAIENYGWNAGGLALSCSVIFSIVTLLLFQKSK